MSLQQAIIFSILFFTLLLFIWGRWRYDVVAIVALIAVALSRTIPADRLFLGFGHPAVITVAAVLVISRGLQNSGLVDLITKWLQKLGNNQMLQLGVMTSGVAALSGFMNNVGALALIMPVAVQIARKNQRSPSYLLMPLAFSSLLGGLLTLIGTPPNIIIGTFRATTHDTTFGMFDFAPVGLGLTAVGVIYIVLFGWRLIPQRQGQGSRDELFHIREYTSEVKVPEKAKVIGKPLSYLELLGEGDVAIIGLVRAGRKLLAPSGFETVWAHDVLIVEANPDALKAFVDATKLELAVAGEGAEEMIKSEEVTVMEAIIAPRSSIVGKNARSLHMRWRYGVNLLAVARQGQRLQERLGRIRFKAGDILLLQGPVDNMAEILSTLGCLPLAKRDLRIGQPRRIILCLGIFAAGLVATVTGAISVQVAFTASALGMLLTGMLSLREVYDSIDWPVIVLLGAMIPLGDAMDKTGGAALLAHQLLTFTGEMPLFVTMGLLLVLTMLLTNLMNNAAMAVLMAPIAVSVAGSLGASDDPFLMTVAVGCSSPFLTPIGHQSNALVMGPGGYRFGDYWKMGLILSILVVVVSIPLILWVWPP